MAYDDARRVVVLFGGYNGSYLQDTWEWNGAAGTWTQRQSSSSTPAARGGHAMTYDPNRRRAVLYGGIIGGDEIWEWDGAAGTWTNRTPSSGTPPQRWMMSAASYDPARSRIFIFGGQGQNGPLQDSWEWNPESASWTEVVPIGPPVPMARSQHALVFTARGKAVLFGGQRIVGQALGDTWEWDGGLRSWVDRTVPHSSR